jgi:predicted TIM-barrel fold metal-dependent hydrolase
MAKKIIDIEHHAAPEDLLVKGNSNSGKICERYWDNDGKMKIHLFQEASRTDRRLQFMDEAGIDIAVLSSIPIHDLEKCKKFNDFCGDLIKQHPERFVGLASIPPLGGKPALDELERSVRDLGLRGAHICTRNGNCHLDSREMWPFYEKVSELAIPIDVHVTLDPGGFDAVHAPYALHYVMAREFDISNETLRICLGGVLEDFPDLIFIMNHFGGGVSTLLERLDAYMSYVGPGCPSLYMEKTLISKPWREYFNKLYFNIAGREVGVATLKSALTIINPEKLMFGTDWPFNYDHNPHDVRRYIEEIESLELSEGNIEGILGGTAAKLLRI